MTKRGQSVQPRVLHYLEQHVGENVYHQDVSKQLDLTESQVKEAIYHLRKKDNLSGSIEVVVAGSIWRYDPSKRESKKSGKRIFEELGVTHQGEIILQDEEGNLFRASEL